MDSGTYLRLLCGCTEADWWQLSTGSLAGTLASLPSHNAPSQPWADRTGAKRAAHIDLFIKTEILTKLTLGLVAGTWYLFGRVCRLGEDGLPVGPHKHDEREVEEDQVDNWRRKKKGLKSSAV